MVLTNKRCAYCGGNLVVETNEHREREIKCLSCGRTPMPLKIVPLPLAIAGESK